MVFIIYLSANLNLLIICRSETKKKLNPEFTVIIKGSKKIETG